jgi:hypothetical protein
MHADAERTLNNLHVLSALSHNDKLMTNEDAFDIYTPTSLRGLVRTWYGERRVQNVQRIRQTIRAGIAFVNTSLEDANMILSTMSEDHHHHAALSLRFDTMALQHFRMFDAVCKSQAGLQNMLQTYREDASLTAQLSLMVTEIDDFRRVMEPHTATLRNASVGSSSRAVGMLAHRDAV